MQKKRQNSHSYTFLSPLTIFINTNDILFGNTDIRNNSSSKHWNVLKFTWNLKDVGKSIYLFVGNNHFERVLHILNMDCLLQMTVVYFEKKKKIKLGDAELRIFVNMWDRTIIASDIFLMAGCIMQFLLTLVVRKLSWMKSLYFVGVSPGIGNSLKNYWRSLLKYNDQTFSNMILSYILLFNMM